MALNKNHVGLTMGIFVALLHALWAIIVAVGVAQVLLDWIFPLHFIDAIYSVMTFGFMTAILLVIMAFIGGYVMGWVFAALWNWISKK